MNDQGWRRLARRTALPLLGAGMALALGVAPAQAALVISEVLYDAVGSDDGWTFVELHGTPGMSLDGLVVEGVNGAGGGVGPSVALSGTVPADGIFVLADATSAGTSQIAGADLLVNFDLQNGPDSVVLRSDTAVLDALGYGAFGAGDVFAGEGTAAPDGAPGESLARRFANVDTGDNAADFVLLSMPTPGSAPLAAVPEPATAPLLLAGLLGLRRAGRGPRPG